MREAVRGAESSQRAEGVGFMVHRRNELREKARREGGIICAFIKAVFMSIINKLIPLKVIVSQCIDNKNNTIKSDHLLQKCSVQ